MPLHISGAREFLRPAPVPKMPPGLMELMEGMATEVLRNNPTDVYGFCARHMEQLLVIRDGKAPKTRKLTLEEKIKIAQERVREKAEQRRRKYDEDMKKLEVSLADATFVEKESPGLAIKDIDRVPEDVKSLANIEIDNHLKAPVHHEKELTDDLEVEIFHKIIEKKEADHTVGNNSNIQENNDTEVTEVLEAQENRSVVDSMEKQDRSDIITMENLEYESADSINVAPSDDHIKTIGKDDQVQNQRSEENDHKLSEINLTENARPMGSVDVSEESRQVLEATVTLKSEKEDDVEINEAMTGTNEPEIVKNKVILETGTDNTDIDRSTVFAAEVLNFPEKGHQNIEEVSAATMIHESDGQNKTKDDDSLSKQKYIHETDKSNIDTFTSSKALLSDTEASTDNCPKKDSADYRNKAEDALGTDIGPKLEVLNRELKSEDINMVVKTEDKGDLECNHIDNGAEEIVNKPNSTGVDETVTQDTVNLNDNERLNKPPEILRKTIDENNKSVDNEMVIQAAGVKDSINDKNTENDENGSGNHQDLEQLEKKAAEEQKSEKPDAIIAVDKVLVEKSNINDTDVVSLENIKNLSVENSELNDHLNGSQDIIGNIDETPETKNMLPPESSDISINNEMKLDQNVLGKVVEHPENISDIETKTETSTIEQTSSIDDSMTEEGVESIAEIEIYRNKDTPNAMDLETAAVTIQKVFRSFLFKRSTFDETGIDGKNSVDEGTEEVEFPVTTTPNKERRTLGISRMDTVLQTVNEEKSLSLSTDDSSLSSAATIIQAHVRGFLVRNRLNSNRTNSTSLGKSEGLSNSQETDINKKTGKTVLNIHIVPDGGHFISRDESLLTSMELSLDGSPPTSTTLHPLGYDVSERRKQLKREDAIQSISPPSNNSGKLSEDVDSVKDMILSDEHLKTVDSLMSTQRQEDDLQSRDDDTPTKSTTIETVVEAHKINQKLPGSSEPENKLDHNDIRKTSLVRANSDEIDVICEDKASTDSDTTLGLLHSGEFHDILLPTKVSRADPTVVREFKTVLVYFLLWNSNG